MISKPAATDEQTPDVPPHIEDTVRAIAEVHAGHYQQAAPLQRMVSKITAAFGRPGFVVLLTVIIAVWVGSNLTIMRMGWEPWDPPPFTGLAGAASLLALYTTVLILATQRHDDELARKREMLTLEIAILTEQKSAKIIEMLDHLRQDSPHLADRSDDQTRAMSDSADPHLILGAVANRTAVVDDTWGVEIYAELAPATGEHVIKKHRYSGFFGTDLDIILREWGINTVIISGTTTENCCFSTARDAMFRNYQVAATYDYPDRGFGAMPNEQVHHATLVILADSTAHVMPVAEMARRIRR